MPSRCTPHCHPTSCHHTSRPTVHRASYHSSTPLIVAASSASRSRSHTYNESTEPRVVYVAKDREEYRELQEAYYRRFELTPEESAQIGAFFWAIFCFLVIGALMATLVSFLWCSGRRLLRKIRKRQRDDMEKKRAIEWEKEDKKWWGL